MPSRRIRPLVAADIPALPDPCGRCYFWEASLADLAYPAEHRDRSRQKMHWAQSVTDRWGHCGVVAVNDKDIIAFLTMAPAALVPRMQAFPTTPVSSDAAVVLSVRVVDEHRGRGVGRQLVQAAAALAARRDLRALEAVGTEHPEPSCMLSTGWLESVGFVVVRPHPITPRLRLDLQSTARWRSDLGAAWSRLTDLVQSPTSPEPASYAHRSAS